MLIFMKKKMILLFFLYKLCTNIIKKYLFTFKIMSEEEEIFKGRGSLNIKFSHESIESICENVDEWYPKVVQLFKECSFYQDIIHIAIRYMRLPDVYPDSVRKEAIYCLINGYQLFKEDIEYVPPEAFEDDEFIQDWKLRCAKRIINKF